MADFDVAFQLVFFNLAIAVYEEDSVILNVVIRFIVPLTLFGKLLFVACAVIVHEGSDFLKGKHGVHPFLLVIGHEKGLRGRCFPAVLTSLYFH
jgi:hypothetical protein